MTETLNERQSKITSGKHKVTYSEAHETVPYSEGLHNHLLVQKNKKKVEVPLFLSLFPSSYFLPSTSIYCG
jgi:hypothetical protein